QFATQEGKQVLPLLLEGKAFFALLSTQYDDVTGGRLPDDHFVARLRSLSGPSNAPLPDVVMQMRVRPAEPGGQVVAWGSDKNGQVWVPAELSGVRAIAAGNAHSLALDGGGHVTAWGANERGQARVPAGLSEVIAIAAGMFHSLALHHDGHVTAWGSDEFGQATVPPGLTDVIAIAAGYRHSLAL